MKILLRSDYQWHEAKWNPTSKVISLIDNDNAINETQIVSIQDDERSKYVICKNCGETILNTPAAIKKHYELSKSSKTCLSCSACRQSEVKEVSKKYVENPDGTYDISTKVNAKLYCANKYYYKSIDINSPNARQQCKYAACERTGVEAYQDIFTKYPGLFDDILTVDVLRKKQWKFIEKLSMTRECVFKVPINFNLYAVVNEFGFIDHFYYTFRHCNYEFVYSPKYLKLIWKMWNRYIEDKPNYDISDSVIEKLQKKVIELYKEADK